MTTMEERRIIAIGKTGSGKSTILNKLLGEDKFVVSNGIDSQTEVIAQESVSVVSSASADQQMRLIAYDTPGIADSKNRSVEFLDAIMNCLKANPFNSVLLLFDYSNVRMAKDVHDTLAILRRCFNGQLTAQTTMLILNKVPVPNPVDNRTHDEIHADCLTFARLIASGIGHAEFTQCFFVDSNGANIDEAVLSVRSALQSCVDARCMSNVKTWSEVMQPYTSEMQSAIATRNALMPKIESNRYQTANTKRFRAYNPATDSPNYREFLFTFYITSTPMTYAQFLAQANRMPWVLELDELGKCKEQVYKLELRIEQSKDEIAKLNSQIGVTNEGDVKFANTCIQS